MQGNIAIAGRHRRATPSSRGSSPPAMIADPGRATAAAPGNQAPDRPAAGRTLRATVPLIGRERELGELHAMLEVALAGSGRTVLLCGEPGIGKTRLTSALAAHADTRGVPVWWGRGFEDGSAPAYWPWNTALRRWLDQVGPATVVDAAGAWGAELAHVFPVLRDHLTDLPAGESWPSEAARFRLFDIVSRFLAAIARPQGLVVVLDDLHWADGPSLKLLEFLASDLGDARLLVVGTYRDTEVRPDHALHATLSRLAREPSTRRMLLGGLSSTQCARWVASTKLRAAAAALGDALYRETSGNPFFVGELVHLLSADDEAPAGCDAQRVPHGVREVVARRVDRLGDECRATLEVAALLGDTIDTALLGEILDDALVADRLARAARDRVLLELGERRYGFAHALIRRVVADELTPSARAVWHARIAAVLERHATASDEVTTELVHHLAAAGTAAALRKAFDYACQGAEHAARDLGWEEAVRLYEIALDLGQRSGLLEPPRSIELRLGLARALRGAGDVPRARARCEEVLAASRRNPNPEAFARAALIHAGLLPEWGRVEPRVRAVLEEACRLGPSLDDGLRARLYGRLAGDLIAANELAQGERVFALCDEAAAAARRAGEAGALAIALMGTYYASRLGMRPATQVTVPSSDEILAAAEAGGEHEFAAAIRHARAMTLLAIGEPEAFSTEVDALTTAAASSRVPEALWLADALAALRATLQGRFEEARTAMDHALATGRRMQLANAVAVHASQRIMWHAFQGRLAEIATEVEEFVAGHPGGIGWRPFRGLARLACGDTATARAELQLMLANGLAPAQRGAMARCYLAGLVALCVGLRDREHAPQLYEHLTRRPDAWSVDGFQTLGPWALSLGALARLCGRLEDAAAHFEEAIRLGLRMGSRPIVARAQSMLASVRLSLQPTADERRRIVALLEESGQCARELGLVDVSARVARLQGKVAQAAAPSGNAFRCDGDVWTVRYDGRDVRLKDGKGPRYLATLLAAPRREVHVLQFAAAPVETSCDGHEGLSIGALGGSLDDAPDQRARREYRTRVDELRAEADEAEERGDASRAERLREELEDLVAQLARVFGGRAARSGPAETARKAVTKVLRTQIGKLLDVHPALGRHLRDTVRMGTVCVYAPSASIDWEVGFAPG